MAIQFSSNENGLFLPLQSGAKLLLESSTETTSTFPIKSVERQLYYANGKPFYFHADTSWAASLLTQDDFAMVADLRKTQGFNALQYSLLSIFELYARKNNDYGDYPFAGNESPNMASPTAVGGVTDDTSPSYGYWDNILWQLNYLKSIGMVALVAPAFYGWQGGSWRGYVTAANAAGYGTFVGTLLANCDNVMWLMGGDNNPTTAGDNIDDLVSGGDATDKTAATNLMANAIKAAVNYPALMTYHEERDASASAIFLGQPWYNLRAAYSSLYTHREVRNEVTTPIGDPTIMVEAWYEGRAQYGLGAPDLNDHQLRQQSYWSFLSGASGVSWGDEEALVRFPVDWATNLSPTSTGDIALINTIMAPFGDELQADTLTSTNALLAGGRGDDAVDGESVAPSALRRDRTYGVAYFPKTRTGILINLARINKTIINAKWVNPDTGAETVIGTYTGTGTQSVTYPVGWADALLVIEASGADVVAPAPQAKTDKFANGFSFSEAAWSKYDPLAAASIWRSAGQLFFEIPGALTYDLTNTVSTAPQYLQNHEGDFDIVLSSETQVRDAPTGHTRGWGIVASVGEAGDHYRVVAYDTPGGTAGVMNVIFARTVAGVATNHYNAAVGGLTSMTGPLYLRLKRASNVWSAFWSLTGVTWTQLSTDQAHTMATTKVGPVVISAGSAWTVAFNEFIVDGWPEQVADRSNTVPGAPTGLGAIADDGAIDLLWTAPSSNGGAPISDYRIQWRTTAGPGSWNTFADGTSTLTLGTVTGLTNGTSYDFQVAAINEVGISAYSSTVTATPAIPSPTFGNVIINSTNSTTIAKPSGLADGDHLVAWYWRDNTATDTLASIGIPGFTEHVEFATYFEQGYGLYTKYIPSAAAETDTSYTMTYPDTNLGQGRLMMGVLKNADPTNPIAGITQHRTGNYGSTPLVMPTLTPSVTGGLGVIFAGGYAFSITNWTVGSGWTVAADYDASASLMYATANANLTTSPTGTVSVNPGDSAAKAAGVMVAFSPVQPPPILPVYRSGVFHGRFDNKLVAKPAGLAVGDLMLAYEWAWSGFYNTGDSDNRLGAPANWTTHAEVVFGNGPAHGLYWRIADASDVAASTFTFRADSNGLIIVATVEAGTFNTTTPIGAYSINRHVSSGATITATTITAPVASCLGVYLGVADTSSGWTPPSGYVERLDVAGGQFATGIIATNNLSTSATGSVSATAGGSAPADQAGSALVAIRPA